MEAFIDGVAGLGIPRNPDYNGASQAGVGYMQRLIENGWRVSSARAFLRPASKRGNLDVRVGAHASRILLDGKRAVGVAYVEAGNPSAHHVVRARREVIVSSGPLNSPKLLHLSGIGPAGVLRNIGIDVLHELPGVGENLHDHYGARGVARIRNSKTANDLSRWPISAWKILKWLTGRPSIVGLSASIAYVFWKSDEVLDRPDLQFVLTPISFKAGQFGVLDDFPGMSLGVWPHRPQSRGYVRARSTNPLDPPVIQPNYLSSSARPAHAGGGPENGAQVPRHAPAQPLRGARGSARPAGRHRRRVPRLRPPQRLDHLPLRRQQPHGPRPRSHGRGGPRPQGARPARPCAWSTSPSSRACPRPTPTPPPS